MSEKIKHTGKLEAFWETGTEGVLWRLNDENKIEGAKHPTDSLVSIDTGDHLKVISDEDQVVFDSIIVKTTKSNRVGWANYAGSQQVAGSHWCHWLQHGTDPDFWAYIFNSGYRAELTKQAHTEEEVVLFLEKTPCTDNKVDYSKKVYNQCHWQPLNEKPAFISHFIEMEKDEFEENNLDYYNAQTFFLKLENIIKDTELNHIWLTTDGELNGFSQAEYKLDSYPNDTDFKHFTNEIVIPVSNIFDYLPTNFPFSYQEMSDEQFERLKIARIKQRQDRADIYLTMREQLRTFKMKHQGKYLHSCLIKFR